MKQGFGNDLTGYGTYSHFTGVKKRYPEKEKDFSKDMQQVNAFLVPLPAQGASLVARMVNNLPAMQETWVQSLGWEVPLEKAKATHSSILAWRIPWTEDPGRLQSMGSQRVGHN